MAKIDEHNIPVLEVRRDMVEVCRDYVLEDKPEEYRIGWKWFIGEAFTIIDGDYPDKVVLPDDVSEEFKDGAFKCQALIDIFYDNATKLIVGGEESEEIDHGNYD